MTKDIEADTPSGYDAFASPKIDGLQGGASPPVQGASVLTLMLISLPRLAVTMTWSAQFAALGPYLGTMLSNFVVQLTQVIGPICSILIGHSIGVFSDKCTSKWGRRRPLLVAATIASVICWILMGYTREIGEALGDYSTGLPNQPTSRRWTAFFAIVFYAWMDITVNMVQTPTFLFIADFAGDRQTLGAAIDQGWSLIGSTLVVGYIYIFGPAHQSLRWFLGTLSAVMVICVAIACMAMEEIPLERAESSKTSTWKQVKEAFGTIIKALKTLPMTLTVFYAIFFCVSYGYSSYQGNNSQFFGFVVYDGVALGADNCDDACTTAQKNHSKGKIGTKWVLALSLVPQCLLVVVASTKVVAIDVLIVVLTSVSQSVVFSLLVPIIVFVMGNEIDIGVYVSAINSAQCFGQLLNFAVGSAMVETSMGYKLPVFLGGIVSVLAVVVFKLKMHTM